MVAQQRQAVYGMAVTLFTLTLFVALMPVLGSGQAQGAFGVAALLGLQPVFFRKRAATEPTDERDRLIHSRSLLIASFLLLGLIWAWVTAVYVAHHGTGTVRVSLLMDLVWLALFAFYFCQSASVLLLYWWL